MARKYRRPVTTFFRAKLPLASPVETARFIKPPEDYSRKRISGQEWWPEICVYRLVPQGLYSQA
jgi:hypothetical protein